MGRQKNSPKKCDNNIDHRCLEYYPIIKKRKRPLNNTSERYIKLTYPLEESKKYYLGKILLGTTNNVFPNDHQTMKVCFKFAQDESEVDSIVLLCDNISVIIKSYNTDFIKELVSHNKVFSFNILTTDEHVYLHVYLSKLPLLKFSRNLGNCIKTLFTLLFEEICCPEQIETTDQVFHKGSEITKLYSKIIEKQQSEALKEEYIHHPWLVPKLRPYQEKSVQWMLQRERIEHSNSDDLHPLYTSVKLPSDIQVYLDKYTGYITSDKPVAILSSKGGILADEMGLGKTVEVLACILLNSRTEIENNNIKSSDDESDDDTLLYRIQKRKRKFIIDSDNESEDEQTSKIKSTEESTTPMVTTQKKKPYILSNTDNVDQNKKIKIDSDVNNSASKKSATFQALNMWYQSVLSLNSAVRSPKINKTEKSVQCICGNTSDVDSIICSKCNKIQHKDCLGYNKRFGKYVCPQCWINAPILKSKGTLIVTPLALKTQWCKEIRRHIKGSLKVLQYKGSSATPVYPTKLKDYDIVLTTYSVLQNELRLTENGQTFNLRNDRKYSPPGCPLTTLNWWRLCLDEAQTVESPTRLVSEMARKISAVHRWAVTGTPISKNISDIFGLIDYLQISPYNEKVAWDNILYEPYLSGNEKPLINFLSDILWRTAKKDVIDQINIPKQTFLEHKLEFSAVEKYFYKREHELISNEFLGRVRKYDLSIHLQSLDKSTLKKLLAPLLTLRHACTHPNNLRGRYLATKKQLTSMKDLLDALILKNTTDSEDCLRLIISAYNGMAGIELLFHNPQAAIFNYRQVLQLAARFSGTKGETKLVVDKPQLIHTMYNLAEVIDMYPPDQPTLRDGTLKDDYEDLQKKYMEKFIAESTAVFESFSSIMVNIEKMHNKFLLKEGQWYSDGLDWVLLKGHFDEFKNKIQVACENASVVNSLWNANERVILNIMYNWDEDLWDLRIKLFESVENLYDYRAESVHKIVVKDPLVEEAMNCHLRPQKRGKHVSKCPVCIANDNLKKYEGSLFGMTKREKTFEEMSLKGSWKPSLQELTLKTLYMLLKTKNAKIEYVKDGELHVSIIDNLKKEFKELRKLWTLLDQQICARDELDICKVRLQLKTDNEYLKKDKMLKNLTYDIENKHETINLLGPHELDYNMSLLENEVKQNTTKLDKLLGTQSYLETLRKQQYEGQSPDPCPICKNTLEQHWSILLCGHSYCLDCIQVLLEQTARDRIQCSVCRNHQKLSEISYIKAGNTTTNEDCKTITGNYSTKVEAVIKLLLEIRDENPAVKVLLFSSWKTVLVCLKEALNKNMISCELGDSVNLDKKITNFKDPSKNIMAFLLPINLGSKGLNLIEATHVILVEPLLNPADELQAIGRVNRIGQTKPTFVHKFIVKNTIEENIYQATSSDAQRWEKNSVTLQDLVDLFVTTELQDINQDYQSVQIGDEISQNTFIRLENIPEVSSDLDENVVEDRTQNNLEQVTSVTENVSGSTDELLGNTQVDGSL